MDIISERTNDSAQSLASSRTLFLSAAFVSFLLSVYLWFSGDREAGLFVGLWVPSICSAGALFLGGQSHE